MKIIEEYESRMCRSDGDATSAMFASRNKVGKSKRHNPNSVNVTNKNKNSNIKCFKCEKTGHLAKQCKKNKQAKKSTGDSTNSAEITMCVYENTHHEIASNSFMYDVKIERNWCMDSGATSHMSNDEIKFSDIRPNGDGSAVNFANNASTKSRGRGTVQMNINDKINIMLKDTLLVPDLRTT